MVASIEEFRIGVEVLLDRGALDLEKSPFGILANQASVDRHLVHTKDLLSQRYPKTLKCLFSPQHGFRGEKQDNMIVSSSYEDSSTGLPVNSLYGENRAPSPEMLKDIEVLVVDLQDVGTRVYTFIYTMALCMMACRRDGKRIVVLDRPNPIGGRQVQGNILETECVSFVGMYPIPMRHGLTIGELALMMNERFGIGADLELVPMRGWRRDRMYPDIGRPFVPPSPNMPIFETAQVYPGQVIWEGTNVSEGRGTTRPFEMFGAPYIRATELKERFLARDIPGVVLREIAFEPTFSKWAGETCHGFHLHVVDADLLDIYYVSLCLLQDVMDLYPDGFEWKAPPYEYEYRRMPIDLILGSRTLRLNLEQGADLANERKTWEEELSRFREDRKPFLLYE